MVVGVVDGFVRRSFRRSFPRPGRRAGSIGARREEERDREEAKRRAPDAARPVLRVPPHDAAILTTLTRLVNAVIGIVEARQVFVVVPTWGASG